MEKIRVLIVDDEPLAREGMRMRLERERDLEVVGECSNGREAVAAIERHAPELVFLDVQMPALDGFGVIETVGAKRMPQVIFVTAYDEHALRAFEVHALDYLLKPVDGERLIEALNRARSRIRGPGLAALGDQLRAMVSDLKAEKKYLARLSIKDEGRILLLGVEDIDWIEAADNYVVLHAGRESHMLHTSLSRLEDKLDPETFLRIHRSTIINLKRIKELQPMFHGEYRIILKDGTRLTSGRSYRDRLQRLLDNKL
jgi:two-component system, LytTR family, response regulator